MLTALTLILILNDMVCFINDCIIGKSGGGFMERMVKHMSFLVVSIASGVSAVCSGLVGVVPTSGCGLEGVSALGFHLS